MKRTINGGYYGSGNAQGYGTWDGKGYGHGGARGAGNASGTGFGGPLMAGMSSNYILNVFKGADL